MSRWVHALMLALCGGCSRADAPKRSVFVTREHDLTERAIRDLCVRWSELVSTFHSDEPRERVLHDRNECLLAPKYGGAWVTFSWEGTLMGSGDSEVCALTVHSEALHEPLPLGFLYVIFRDPDLGEKIHRALGDPDPTRTYDVSATVDGVRARASQYIGIAGPKLEVVLDGCAHPTGRVEAVSAGRPGQVLEFAPHPPPGRDPTQP